MTTKLKEIIVAISRNKKVEKLFNKFSWGLLAISLISIFFLKLTTLTQIMSVLAILMLFIYFALNAIKKQTDEVIKNNKLINIVLSDIDAVEHYVLWIFNIPIATIIFVLFEINIITGIIYIVFALFSISKLSKIISKHFKNKLS